MQTASSASLPCKVALTCAVVPAHAVVGTWKGSGAQGTWNEAQRLGTLYVSYWPLRQCLHLGHHHPSTCQHILHQLMLGLTTQVGTDLQSSKAYTAGCRCVM